VQIDKNPVVPQPSKHRQTIRLLQR
jgi:hypothetical protein